MYVRLIYFNIHCILCIFSCPSSSIEVDKVADMVVDMEVDKMASEVADMVVEDMVGDVVSR